MATKKPFNSADYVVPVNINGMQGRMLHVPAKRGKKRNILLIAGHHTSIERLVGVIEQLNKYGDVTSPDLPGFGGMDSFYKIGKQPTLDNLADYLAAFIRLRYKKHERFVIIGISFGFAVVTRMLQKYPEIAARADFVVSLVGLVHKDDFALRKRIMWELRTLTSFLQHRIPAWLMLHVALQPRLIRTTYHLYSASNPKMKGRDRAEQDKLIDFEINLWRQNDTRTHAFTTLEMFNLDLCNAQVKTPVYHVAVKGDRYFDNHYVEQHMRIIYSDFELIESTMKGHVPTVIADAKDAAPFVPKRLRELLSKK
ncbi:MAG TPA: alpha/beta hydrolase [Candidatus Saccharimonadales bacterium]|nr:alpha/beta hydrolase [Candidatus Saccharimonadales bacterium]